MDCVCFFFACSLNSLLGLYVYLLRLIWGKAPSKSGINYVCIIGKRIVVRYLVACWACACTSKHLFVCLSSLPLPFPVFSLFLHLIRLKSVSFSRSLSLSPFLNKFIIILYTVHLVVYVRGDTIENCKPLSSLCNVHNCVISSMFWDTVHISK